MSDRWSPSPRNQTSDFDVLMNALGAFIVLFALAIMVVQQSKKKTDEPGYIEGIYRVSITWDKASDDDVDLYVQDPAGNIAYFQSKENGLMHLERDDRGLLNDVITLPTGERALVQDNEEHVILRGTLPGEYIVNVHMYQKRDGTETPVTVMLRKSAGNVWLYGRTVTLTVQGDEKTAFRFILDKDGNLVGTNELETKLVRPKGSPPSTQGSEGEEFPEGIRF